MQHRIAHETADRSPRDARTGVVLGVEPAAALAGARRRAVRDQDREADTAHLLHSLIEADPRTREVLGSPRVARLLGYLVQRSIGYGLKWRSSVENSGALPAIAEPGLSPSAARAMAAAVLRAQGRGDASATGLDLLAALTEDPACRAVEVLRRAAVDPAELGARAELARIDAIRGEEAGI